MIRQQRCVSQAVAWFFDQLREAPDETLSQYLITVLTDTESSAVDSLELKEIVAGFSSTFEELPAPKQHQLILRLVDQARSEPLPQKLTAQPLHKLHGQVSCAPQLITNAEQRPSTSWSPHGRCITETRPASSLSTCGHSQQLQQLCELCPVADAAYLQHILQDACHGKLEDAAQWVLDQDDLLELQSGWQARQQQQEQAAVVTAKQDKENRKRLLSKYDLQAVHTGPTILADARHHSSSKATTKVRYREGMIVTARGEKYVTEKVGEDWNGGSKGKVFTKGKRGKGTV